MAFLLLWLTASLVTALYNVVDALRTAGNQKLCAGHDRIGEKRNGGQLDQKKEQRKKPRRDSTNTLAMSQGCVRHFTYLDCFISSSVI